MDIKTFINVISNLPPDIAVLAKGPTGIGKSHIVHKIAKNLSLPVIDRRLSQMTEGDIIGLPELIDGVTRFAPIDWYVRACKEPVVLFFDELNRATIEVQQCAFQIVLDRELNGHKLHPETRVYAAVNEGADYQVTEMDPALLRRFWAIDLEPTTQDWLDWAMSTGNISELIINFIKRYPAHLRHVGDIEPGKVYPNPASWARLNQALRYAGIDPDQNCGENYHKMIYPMSLGFIGATTAIPFQDFVKNFKMKFSAKDVLNDYDSNKKMLSSLTNDKKNDLLQQIVLYVNDNKDITLNHVKNVWNFTETCSDEMAVSFFQDIMDLDVEKSEVNLENIKKFSKYYSGKLQAVFDKSLGV